jgi:hypothetical protein
MREVIKQLLEQVVDGSRPIDTAVEDFCTIFNVRDDEIVYGYDTMVYNSIKELESETPPIENLELHGNVYHDPNGDWIPGDMDDGRFFSYYPGGAIFDRKYLS